MRLFYPPILANAIVLRLLFKRDFYHAKYIGNV